MAQLRRLLLIRHGETDGESSIRYHGSADVPLSEEGRGQMRRVAGRFRNAVDRVVASPLRRSWQAAWIVGGGAPVQLEPDFREVDFGRWEGLTQEEIQARDPVAFEDWQSGAEDFAFPSGESRKEFQERVQRGLDRLLASGAGSALVVAHKGTTRAIVRALTGSDLPAEEPALGGAVVLTRDGDGSWFVGTRSSNPEGVDGEVVL